MLTLYVGPTAYGLQLPGGIDVRPPVRRGDLRDLVRTTGPGTVAIADGTFHAYPSVGHAEIREALDAGWTVWGLCSMGAIRAAEMRHLGMRGFGAVYERYAGCDDFDDDEVALVHQEEAPFRPLSEPLIHIREFLLSLELPEHDRILKSLKQRWYAERTLEALRELLRETGQTDRSMAGFDAFRLKRSDLVRFLAERPWERAVPVR